MIPKYQFFDDKEEKILQLVVQFKKNGWSLEQVAAEAGISQKRLEDWFIVKMGDRDFEFFCKSQLYIEDGSTIIPFVLNSAQSKLLTEIERQKSLERPIRLLHLKPRQYGATTFFSGYIYRELKRKKNRHATTISYSLASAEHIRNMAERYHKWDRLAKPTIRGKSEKQWRFTDNDSSWMIETAENVHAGHSFTNQILHASELSRWQGDAETLMRGLTSTIQALPDTMIVIESTANGFGDYFYHLWSEAKGGRSTYVPIFISWLEIEKYTMPFANEKTFDGESKASFERKLGDDERKLQELGASLEQLHWRAFKVKELKGDTDGFKEQYPATDIEAFLSSGRPYFPVGITRKFYSLTSGQQNKRGNLKWVEYGKEVEFEEDNFGLWVVNEFPQDGYENRYVSGADPAEGKADEANKNPDFSECYVYDRVKKKNPAMLKARIDTDVFEDEIYKAYVWYNQCLLCPERNNTAGGAIIRGLKDREGVNLYRKVSITKINEDETEEYGFRTDQNTREELLGNLKVAIKNSGIEIPFSEFWSEAVNFIIDKTGKPIHQTGEHDDGIFANALSLQAAKQASETFPIESPEERREISQDSSPTRDEEENKLIYAIF